MSDRYLPSTLVLQQLDQVPFGFIIDVNRHVPMPDLAVILTAQRASSPGASPYATSPTATRRPKAFPP
ncbi:hypothetical protein [Streptomyces sp. NPDC127197]|uniref:hypothetical protein n=1 Tax=Streptomyces sp. NPDC127197 TaxID=3345388 RepID=UPI003645B5CD